MRNTANQRLETDPMPGLVLIYDGRCGLCHKSVRHILNYDRQGRFRFAANTTPTGRRLLMDAGLTVDPPPESMVLVSEGRVFTHSDAALEIARQLGGIHSLALPGRLVPHFLRDRLYTFIANRRYRLFGHYETCRLPSPGERAKFLDAGEVSVTEVQEETAVPN